MARKLFRTTHRRLQTFPGFAFVKYEAPAPRCPATPFLDEDDLDEHGPKTRVGRVEVVFDTSGDGQLTASEVRREVA